jgi:hypothetical protein
MADLPDLPNAIQRKLALKWSTVLDTHGLTGKHLHWHDAERNRMERIQAQMGTANRPGRGPSPGAERAVDHVGIRPSVNVAERRFKDLCHEYWGLWYSSGGGYETFEDWLHVLKLQVSEEVASIWKPGLEAVHRWYQRACAPAVDNALDTLVTRGTRQAREQEVKRLERTPAAYSTGKADGHAGGARHETFKPSELESHPENDRQTVQLRGPDDVELSIYPAGECYVWQLRNAGLRTLREIRLEVRTLQSFDDSKRAFREPLIFSFRWPLVKELGAGSLTEKFVFVRFEGDQVGLWNIGGSHLLPWPNGDLNQTRCWRLSMNVIGLSRDWPINLCVRWTLGTKILELTQVDNGAPADRTEPNDNSTAGQAAPERTVDRLAHEVTPNVRSEREGTNGPQVCFERWGDVPADDPLARRLESGSSNLGEILQKGFHLVNDGAVAHEITVENFEIEPSVLARSKTLARIPEKGQGFAYVWLEGYSPWTHASGKWDLIGAMARASDAKFGETLYKPGYTVQVSVTYRDAHGRWYRSTAPMTYIQSQGRIEFGPTTHTALGDAARDNVSRSGSPQDSGEGSPPGFPCEDLLLGVALDSFQGDTNARPLGDNPFPAEHPAYSAFEEASWRAKEALNGLRLELLETLSKPPFDIIQSVLSFRVRAFSACANAALLIVGNEETAERYELWIVDFAKFVLKETLQKGQLKDPQGGPESPLLFTPALLPQITVDLNLQLMRVVAHYKKEAAKRVLQVMERRARKSSNEQKTAPEGTLENPLAAQDAAGTAAPTGGEPENPGAAGATSEEAQGRVIVDLLLRVVGAQTTTIEDWAPPCWTIPSGKGQRHESPSDRRGDPGRRR